ncbi:acyl-CoA dehydrogenase type 2 [Salinisphaera sp. S4-8]|uniref:acyl-CoA dehydrogenase family protein n=1 Tax=Salinisphaera sp. S4-8 TaxID=633357 RepID=UPI00333E3103
MATHGGRLIVMAEPHIHRAAVHAWPTGASPQRYDPLTGTATDWLAITDALAERLDSTAAERDREGGHAATERALIRESGLLGLSVPKRCGGAGMGWSSLFDIVRRLAAVDSALAHVFAFHHLQVATVRLYGTSTQATRLLEGTISAGWFWGNALNPRDRRCQAEARAGGGYVFTGDKGFCSGSVDADMLTVSAVHAPTDSLVIAAIPATRAGVTIRGDWDAIGQRQTDSGTVGFDQVTVHVDEVLIGAGQTQTPAMQLRSCLAQLVLVNLYVGIARGAIDKARTLTRERARPWAAADVDAAVDDPYLQHRYGRVWARLRAAEALAEQAAQRFDTAYEAALGEAGSITAAERGAVAIAVAEAKVAAHDIALDASSELFELAGTAAVAKYRNLDRFWRNARTHTLHDPIDYKLRDLGRWALLGRYPEPTSYS